MFDPRRLQDECWTHAPAVAGADETLSRQRRREQGAYFTPQPLVRYVVERTLEPLSRILQVGRIPRLRVVDPACGDGRFLEAAERWLLSRLELSDGAASELRERCLIGIERDPQFATLARERLPGARIECAEALSCSVMTEGADVFVGNPPYLRSIHLGASDLALRESLRGRFEATSYGEWDLYAAFLEHAFDCLRPGGQLGFVVPSRWWTAAFAVGVRAKLAARRAVRGLLDFGAEQVFDGATTYASAVFLSSDPVSRTHVARLRGKRWEVGSIEADSLSATPWKLSVGSSAGILAALEVGRSRLGSVARIIKGAGTNCDPAFVFDRFEVGTSVTRVFSRATGQEVELENDALRRCVRGRDVASPLAPAKPALALVPYHSDGTLWSPQELADSFPRVRNYLEGCRVKLEARERGRFAGDRFYCYGRPQNMVMLMSDCPRIVVPDVARGERALVDRQGIFVLDSAYAVVPDEPETVEALAAILASQVVLWWLRERGVLLRGGYVRMKTAYLRELPIPDLSALSAALRRSPESWRRAVAEAYGLAAVAHLSPTGSPPDSTLSATSSGRS